MHDKPLNVLYQPRFDLQHPGTAAMRRHLRSLGHNVPEATSITMVIDNILCPEFCDVVVTEGGVVTDSDTHTQTSGLPTLVAIRSDRRLRSAPVIVVEDKAYEARVKGKGGIFADREFVPESVNEALKQVRPWQRDS